MSFGIGLSGMKAAKQDLEVVSNNIANSNTVGFKSSRSEFADLYASSLGGGNSKPAGVKVANTSQQFTQGNLTYTNSALDLAISGNGFFVLNDNGQQAYTRAGYFSLDQENYLVNNQGLRLQGFSADENGNILTGTQQDLQVSAADMQASASSTLTGQLNLDARNQVPTSGTFSAADPESYNSTMAFNIYDSQGNPHILSLYFSKTSDNNWDVNYQFDGEDLDPATTITGGPLVFNNDGTLASGGDIELTGLPISGVDPLDLTLDLSKITQLGTEFSVNQALQNGYPAGKLTGIEVDENGSLRALYSNGQTRVQGQIIMAGFANESGLNPIGDSLWRGSFASGAPIYGLAGAGTLGSLQAGALEQSNVDLSIELVRLIEAQRNYQANAKTIETSNNLTQTLLNII
ncbi:flagellar hook protein FlgE [Parendozoicomonas haliclonae]|uniref:Flagellar hook protein FlgE n=1 Tax=Parendozoicomonas haliclonae TaxID=1960125 RepID=A0A1X7AGI8_9GAMM|nr:flagellar hook protein FlgE [Parendozoicomonas haliclonae]SMA39781.1 Flagellar hook protein FlgE [Parendozoicomonas haliclonae]